MRVDDAEVAIVGIKGGTEFSLIAKPSPSFLLMGTKPKSSSSAATAGLLGVMAIWYNWEFEIWAEMGLMREIGTYRIFYNFMVEDGQYMCKRRTMPRDGSSA